MRVTKEEYQALEKAADIRFEENIKINHYNGSLTGRDRINKHINILPWFSPDTFMSCTTHKTWKGNTLHVMYEYEWDKFMIRANVEAIKWLKDNGFNIVPEL